MSMRYQAGFLTASYFPLKVPNAPTIGTATAGDLSASVSFTAPSNTGGGAITSYTAISSPGGFVGTGSSSPVTVSGLTAGTAYTFTVFATNAYGNSTVSSASNSATPTTPVTGQDAYTTAGSYTWVAPARVVSVSVVCVGSQRNDGSTGYQGVGGALSYKNGISVTPGSSYTVVVGSGSNDSYFSSSGLVSAGSGSTRTGDGGGNGGGGSGGGGGAGGYSGNGGNGRGTPGSQAPNASGGYDGYPGSGGGGGGGGGYSTMNGSGTDWVYFGYSGGGGVGLLGEGSSGAGGVTNASSGCTGGSGGSGGANGDGSSGRNDGTGFNGGQYGGGSTYWGSNSYNGKGAVRIIYPGTTRTFPSTNTGDL